MLDICSTAVNCTLNFSINLHLFSKQLVNFFSEVTSATTYLKLCIGSSGSKMSKSYQCSFCDKKCTQKSNLNTHIKLVHDKKKQQCQICLENVSFYSLKFHIATVHNDTKVKCDDCDKMLKKSGMKKHLEEAHNNKNQTNQPLVMPPLWRTNSPSH